MDIDSCAKKALGLIHQTLVVTAKADSGYVIEGTFDKHWIVQTCEQYGGEGVQPCRTPVLPQVLYLLENGYPFNNGKRGISTWNREISVRLLEKAGCNERQMASVTEQIKRPQWLPEDV